MLHMLDALFVALIKARYKQNKFRIQALSFPVESSIKAEYVKQNKKSRLILQINPHRLSSHKVVNRNVINVIDYISQANHTIMP